MSILSSLGVNETVWYMFGLFSVVYFLVSRLVFEPYMKAYLERVQRTVGNREQTDGLIAKTKEIEQEFAREAHKVSESVRRIYEEQRKLGIREQEAVLAQVRTRTDETLAQARKEVAVQEQAVRTELLKYVGGLKDEVVRVMIGQAGG